MGKSYVAIDLGASSGRVITGRLDDGRLITTEVNRFDNTPYYCDDDGRRTLCWPVASLLDGIGAGLQEAVDTGDVVSVGVDTWGADYALLDRRGSLVRDSVHYRDDRTTGKPRQFFDAMSPTEHYELTGTQVQPFNTVFQLLAEPQLCHANRLLMMPDLLAYWLTGESVTDMTIASTTGLLDIASHEWSARVLGVAQQLTGQNISRLLAPLVEPGTTVGECNNAKWPAVKVVAVGSHDTASAVAAVPMDNPDHTIYISCGTWSLVGTELSDPVLTEASRRANMTNELGVFGTVRYLKNVAGLWLLSESMRTWAAQGRCHDLHGLIDAAANAPACRTVINVDEDAFVAPSDMPSRIADAARATGQPVPDDEVMVTRCILDSLALAYRRTLRTIADLTGRDISIVHVVGGGSRNPLLCQLTADATGLPVVAGPAECTAMGNLLLQACANGATDRSLPGIRRVVSNSVELTRWMPTGDSKIWDQAEDRLRGILAATK